MSGKDLKRNSYWLKDRYKKTIDVKSSKLEDLQTSEHLSKLGVCSFVTKCILDAQKKKIEVELIELIKKVANQKSKKGMLTIANKLIKAIVEEDYKTLLIFSMVALRYLLFLKLVR